MKTSASFEARSAPLPYPTNLDLVSNLKLASATGERHIMGADIESSGGMPILIPSDPESHWRD